MALTSAVYREETGKWIDDQKIFTDPAGNIIWPVALVDGDGNHIITSLTAPAIDLEGLGDIDVGQSEVEIVISGTPREIRIRADVDNTGIIFIGKTGVLSDKTNDYIRLEAGDEHKMPYNDTTNALFAISDTAAQKINVGALLL